MSITDVLLKLDFLAFQIGLEFDNSTRFRSIYGSILSILIIISLIIMGFLFGSEVYKREKPYVTYSNVYSENSKSH